MEAGMYQRQLVMILKSRGSGSALQENLPSRWDMDFIITGCTYAEVAKYWNSGVIIALVLIELWTEEIDALLLLAADEVQECGELGLSRFLFGRSESFDRLWA